MCRRSLYMALKMWFMLTAVLRLACHLQAPISFLYDGSTPDVLVSHSKNITFENWSLDIMSLILWKPPKA